MTAGTTADGVWRDLVGQQHAVTALQRAVAGDGMTHAWLFTGPPGSGRSNAAIAFAAALQCPRGGCGECHDCRTALAGTHADVTVHRTESVQLPVREAKALIKQAALSPVGHRQVLVVEDADRFNDHSGNAMLKAIEEPHARTVWLLCAPTLEDVLPTIRSRCRQVNLVTPPPAEVAAFLERTEGVEPALAAHAARASQGHIGRARALATDEATRERRRTVVGYPVALTSLGACMRAAADLAEVAKAEAEAITSELDAREKAALDAAYGVEERGRRPREYSAALKDLLDDQKRRARRRVIDVVDRGLMDLVSVYRDAIALQLGVPGDLVNQEMRGDVAELARASTPELNLRRIDWIFEAREQMVEFNVPVALALEAMMVALKVPESGGRTAG
jgi:DNA polymerase III subunit delta'